MTRERRTNSKKFQSIAPTVDEDREAEQDEDNSDFESALANSQVYGLAQKPHSYSQRSAFSTRIYMIDVTDRMLLIR